MNIKQLIEEEIKRQLQEQYREPAEAPRKKSLYPFNDDESSKIDVKKNIQAVGMISQQIQKLNPRQKESAMIELSRHFASEAESAVGEISDDVAENLMFLDTEPKQSIKYAVQNVPNDLLLSWLTSYRKIFDSVINTFPDKEQV